MHGQKTGVDGRMGDHYPRVWKPVIAAVNGWAAGAGLYILLSSTDIRIASAEHARFKFALLTQGWLGHGPGASLLAKQLRYIDAMKILLTDEPFDAQEALRIGLINEVVPHAQLLERAEKIARHICTLPPVAVRMMKEFVVRFGDLPTDQAWHVQNLINSLLIQTTMDGEEGRQAFNEKRPPNFTASCAGAATPGRSCRRRTPSGSTRRIAAASSESCRTAGASRPRSFASITMHERTGVRGPLNVARPRQQALSQARRSSAARRYAPATGRGRRRAPDRYPRPVPARGLSRGRSWRATAGPADAACLPEAAGGADAGSSPDRRCARGRPRGCRPSAAFGGGGRPDRSHAAQRGIDRGLCHALPRSSGDSPARCGTAPAIPRRCARRC